MKWLSVLAMQFLFTITCYAQEQATIIDSTSFRYVYMEFQGSHFEIPQNLNAFLEEAGKQNLLSHMTSAPFGIFFDSNLQVAHLDTVWGLGFRVQSDVSAQPPLKMAKYEYEKVAQLIYMGPYESVSALAYNIIIPFIDEEDMEIIGPPVQIWLDDLNVVPFDSCRTQILIPVRKIDK